NHHYLGKRNISLVTTAARQGCTKNKQRQRRREDEKDEVVATAKDEEDEVNDAATAAEI
ncbi:hypothetical protein PIB30_094208, partial [Stylosanthes scabra]|nr:hypothetical protein [Stylosanthes scabra]